MKKGISLLLILLIVGCTFNLPVPFPFAYNSECPKLCWLGISPGITTYSDVEAIITSSNSYDADRTYFWDNRISTLWSKGRTNTFHYGVNIWFEEGLVQNIIVVEPSYKVSEFIDLLSEPDEISIRIILAADAKFTQYSIYFSYSKTTLEVFTHSEEVGPDPDDIVHKVYLNFEFRDTLPVLSGKIQPWLGYGHLNEYSPQIENP